ncbi:MAG: hypothetical protein M0R70_07200 [Nitrospirae bacterium]|nr:hypothetical protein [Nitrospirota bacterium]
MKKSMKKSFAWMLVLLLPLMLLSCSSGGSGSDATATPTPTDTSSLQVADKVSVVDAKLSSNVAAVAPLHIGAFRVTGAELAAASDYKTDKTQVWVSERSAEAFNEINNILCMIAQSKGDAMLNKGAYVALVDETQCDTSKSDASSAGQDSQNQSSSTNMPDYTTFTVLATRVDNNSPQYAKVWVHMKAKGSDPEQVILVNLTITEGKSDTNPYGLFTMNFLGHPSTDGVMDTSQISFKGVMKSEKNAAGEVLLRFAEQNFGPYTNIRKIALNRLADGSGKGSVYDQHPEMDTTVTSQFDIAFNADNFLRTKVAGNTICLDRNQFEESAWRYGLYDTAGARVNRNSGFSVNTMADGSGKYGFIGYYGLWIDNNVTLNNGDFLYKFDYSNTGAAPLQYTVMKAGGKLKKHTKKAMTLAEVKGIPLNYSVCDPNSGCANYQVVWDGTNQVFNKTAEMPQNCSNNCQWQNITPPVILDLTTLQWGELNFYSQSLGGQVRVPLSNCVQTFPTGTVPAPPTTTCEAPGNTTNIIFFAEDIVYPTDTIPASFACYDNCPQVGADGEAYTTMMSSGPSNTVTTYTFDPITMLLNDAGSKPVIMTVATTTNQWGVNSGALFNPTTANLAALDCNWDWDNNPATNAEVCGWKAWSALDVFYTWETGPGSWNQFSALKDATGTMLKFEPPLSVKYVHHKAGSSLDGATFMLDYSGFGNLNGIPGKCVDMDSGLEAQCASDPKIRYVPAFVIPPVQTDGSLTKVMVDATEYLVKPLELEQRMMKVDVGNCSALSVTSYPLPDIATEWTDPALGTEPVVTAAPAVIGGVVQ